MEHLRAHLGAVRPARCRGVLIAEVSARAAIAVFAAVALVLAVWGTLSPSLRTTPSLDKLAEASR